MERDPSAGSRGDRDQGRNEEFLDLTRSVSHNAGASAFEAIKGGCVEKAVGD